MDYPVKTTISSLYDENCIDTRYIRNKTINYIKNDDCIGNVIRNGRYWEEWMIKYIYHSYVQNTNMIDLGGNIGTTSLLMTEVLSPNCKIFTFEPLYSDILLKNVFANYMTDKIAVYPYGLGNEIKTLKIKPFELTDNINFGAVSIIRTLTEDADGIHVPIVPLDYFQFENVSLIKIDVEHMEIEVLEGCIQLIKRCKPTIIIETYQLDVLSQTDVFKELQSIGYQIYTIPEGVHDYIMKITHV